MVHNFTCLYLNYNSLHNASVVQLHSQYTCTEMILHAPLLYIYFARINSFYFWVLKSTKEHAISHMIESKRRKFLLLVLLLYIVAAACSWYIYLFILWAGGQRYVYTHMHTKRRNFIFSLSFQCHGQNNAEIIFFYSSFSRCSCSISTSCILFTTITSALFTYYNEFLFYFFLMQWVEHI